jgi:hypothetical protein
MKTATPADEIAQAFGARPANGTVRRCAPYRGEVERHRIISADGYDIVVTTVSAPRAHVSYLTGAYPVQEGYLVMIRQPYFEAHSATAVAAAEQHEQLVRALAGAGVGIVRARRRLAARQRAEQREGLFSPERHVPSPRHEDIVTPASR